MRGRGERRPQVRRSRGIGVPGGAAPDGVCQQLLARRAAGAPWRAVPHPQAPASWSGPGTCCSSARPRTPMEILNKEFAIAPGDAERACRALFRTFPQTRRIHVEVLFPPKELRLPKRVLYGADHMVVDLPATVDAYTASWARERVGKCDAAGGISRRSKVPSPSRLSLPASRSTELMAVHSSRGRTCASTRRGETTTLASRSNRPPVISPSLCAAVGVRASPALPARGWRSSSSSP